VATAPLRKRLRSSVVMSMPPGMCMRAPEGE
jgi:hypothetical protein